MIHVVLSYKYLWYFCSWLYLKICIVVYICIAIGDPVIERGRGDGIPLTGLTPPHVCACPRHGFHMSWSFLCSFCWYWWNWLPSHFLFLYLKKYNVIDKIPLTTRNAFGLMYTPIAEVDICLRGQLWRQIKHLHLKALWINVHTKSWSGYLPMAIISVG
jgi:hypothetical protein